MSKVLVDRELLERTATHLEWDGSEPMTTIQFAQKCDGLADELRRAIAQPAEAEVAVTKIECRTCRGTGSLEFEGGAVVKDCAPCMGTGRELKAERYALADRLAKALAALSSVTAERDRLREEMCILWNRIDKFESQSHGITALAEIERLRAEVETLRKDAERYRWLREQEAEDGIAVLPVGRWEKPAMLCTTPFDSPEMVDAVVDAALAAKEA